jgi:asparagine synthase (glutamine-hydrolysing)
MCGIVGIAGSAYRTAIMRMNQVQRHRGPDDEGCVFFDDVNLALAMRRLSILDVAGGHQPMSDATGRYTIVYNGEVFNAPQIRCELEAEGVVFRTTSSDTEAILNLYIREGARVVDRLNGMFAFAIYDAIERRLFLARDPLGIKPLHYVDRRGTFAFASELKSLLEIIEDPRAISRESLSHYLTFQYIPAPHSIYAGVNKLPAGHTLTVDLATGVRTLQRYWRPKLHAGGAKAPDRVEIIETLRRHLERAARAWSLSDVEIGCSLSGGVDSAAVTGLLASQGGRRLKTWTLGFDESGKDGQALDERKLAAIVARRWETDHHEIVIRASSLIEDIDDMVDSLDEPYAGGLPSWYVFRAMSRSVKVAMVGSGGDELFGNYGKWRVLQPLTLPWLKQLRRRVFDSGLEQCIRYPHGALYPNYFGEREKRAILLDPPPGESSPALIEKIWGEGGAAEPKQGVASVDMQMQLPEEFLMMTDRFSMRWSVEARPPLLDRELVDYVLTLPSDVRSPNAVLKGTLIESVRDLLPDEIVAARKRGFVLPVARWLRRELRPMIELYFSPEYLRRQGLFRDNLYVTLAKPHLDGIQDRSQRLWTVLMFQLWWDRSTGGTS